MSSPDRLRMFGQAVATGDAKKVRLLLRAGVSAADGEGEPFVITAARFAQADVFDLLIEHGAPIDHPELLEWAVDGDGGRGPVSLHIVQRVLREGATTPADRDAALRVASAGGSADAVDALLAHGASPNAMDPEFMDFPLYNAVLNGHLDIVARLLAAGADPSARVRSLDDAGEPLRTTTSLQELAQQLGFGEIAAMVG